jgi:hypothetical protein
MKLSISIMEELGKQLTDQIRYDQVKAVATEIVAENPDLTNPRGANVTVCLYKRRDDDDTPNAAERCLGGEVLARLGLTLPQERARVNRTTDRDRLTDKAMNYLIVLQSVADSRNGDGSFRTWGEALPLADQDFNRFYGTMND